MEGGKTVLGGGRGKVMYFMVHNRTGAALGIKLNLAAVTRMPRQFGLRRCAAAWSPHLRGLGGVARTNDL